jgi:hypothetical protein
MSYHETFVSCSEDLPEMMDYHQRTVHAEKEDEEVQNAIRLRAEQLREAELQACSQTEDVECAIGNCNVNQTENAMLDVVDSHSFLLQQSSTLLDLIAQYNMRELRPEIFHYCTIFIAVHMQVRCWCFPNLLISKNLTCH